MVNMLRFLYIQNEHVALNILHLKKLTYQTM